MFTARYTPAVGLLPSGKVLVAGGWNESAKYLKSAELFNPATGNFESVPGEMTESRDEAGYAALPGGKVLIVGGYNETAKSLKSAELFNPVTGTFEKVSGEMTVVRDGPVAALLANGKVLIAGGTGGGGTEKTAELYDPAKQAFEKLSAETTVDRYEPAVATLPNGKVLIAGGTSAGGYLKSAELFNPETNTFESLGPAHEMSEARREMGYAALANGKVLLVGGHIASGKDVGTAELFNPETNTFETLPNELTEARTGPAAVLLPGGQVLVVGGYNQAASPSKTLKSAEETSVTPPVVTTSPASSIGETGATLNGSVLGETASTVYFQYGTSSAYGAATTSQTVAASINSRGVSAGVSGLAPGTVYHFRVVAENAGGPRYGADQTFTTGSVPQIQCACLPPRRPVISGLHQSHSAWREGSKLARITSRRLPVGTLFSFTLDEPATVRLVFTQQSSGRRAGGRCVPETKANRRKRACKRTLTRGTMTFTGHLGANKVSFEGRISRSKKLPLGTYTLLITATNAMGRRSLPKQLTFAIVN
jgi:hypothetical protein